VRDRVDRSALGLGALIGALAGIFGAGLTGIIQVVLAGRNAKAAAVLAERERAVERAREAVARKAELYLRWLKWQSTIHATIVDMAITGEGISTELSHTLANYRAEFLLYGSAEVRTLAENMIDVWIDYQDRYKELVELDSVKPVEEQWSMPTLVARAADDVVNPALEAVAEAMRAELEGLVA